MNAVTTDVAASSAIRPAEASAPGEATGGDGVPRERPDLGTIRVLASKELRDAVRDRWFWLYLAGFVIVAIPLTSLSVTDQAASGSSSFGRSAASLVALVQLLVPLMGLTLGARSVVGSREAGTMAFVLSHPVSRTELFAGIFVGNVAAMVAAVTGGFGVVGVTTAARSSGAEPLRFLVVCLLSWLLAVAMVATGMLISVLVRRSTTAIGTALFVWLTVALIGDLGLMGSAVATQMPVNVLFGVAVVNPAEAFRLTAIYGLEGSLDGLGPVGAYTVDTFGSALPWITGGALVLWALIACGVALALFRRGGDL